MKKIFLSTLFLFFSILACSLPNNPRCIQNQNPFRDVLPPFGKEYNPTRAEIGLPVIPEDWDAEYYAGESHINWSDPRSSEHRTAGVPFHQAKTLACVDGVLISESDVYYNNEYFWLDPDSLVQERITVTYYYPTNDTEARWEASAVLKEPVRDLDKEGAIQILAKWGVEYP